MTSARRILGTAILVTFLSGCATTVREFSISHLWPWKQDEDAQGLTADLSKPFPKAAVAKAERPAEFDFNHPLIENQVSRFQDDLHGFYERALERSGRYVPVMQTILERHGVPRELAYLPLIESGYETCAVSPAGAVGPWQFIPGTAVRYGLRVDRMVDERRDPIKSTEAAAKYLRDLYDMFNDWHLALAAYNTGEGNIGRILGSGRADDYWEMVGKGCLYAETENYVPKFMAALEIAQNPEAYGFQAPTADPIVYDWVRVNKPLTLRRVAEMSNADPDVVRDLNPALRQGVVPQSGYIVKLPKGSKQAYQAAVDTVDPDLVAYNPRKHACDPDDGLHCVRRGDTIASIAATYGISARELMQANRRGASYRLKVGEALVIPGRNAKADSTSDDAPAIRRNGKSVTRTATASRSVTKSVSAHKVRKGDTPATIASRYGVSTQELLRTNGIRDARGLKIGQTLKVPTKAGTTRAAAAPTGRTQKQVASAKPAAQAKPAAKSAARAASATHTVKKGDTPASIADRYGVSTQALMRANGLRNTRGLQLGQKLTVPRS